MTSRIFRLARLTRIACSLFLFAGIAALGACHHAAAVDTSTASTRPIPEDKAPPRPALQNPPPPPSPGHTSR